MQTKYLEVQSKNEHLVNANQDLEKQLQQSVKESTSKINHLTKVNHELQRDLEDLKVSIFYAKSTFFKKNNILFY